MTLMTPRTLPGFMELLPKEQLIFNVTRITFPKRVYKANEN